MSANQMESESTSWKLFISNPFIFMREFTVEYSDTFAFFLIAFLLPFTIRSRIEKFRFGGFWIAGEIQLGSKNSWAETAFNADLIPK
jgi:hypothetical protein